MPAPSDTDALGLLQALIAAPSFSGEEQETAGLIERFLQEKGVTAHQHGHNVWAQNRHFEPGKPTLLLCSHHDTVRPNAGYRRNPFEPTVEDGRLYGLGSNDAGGCLAALATVFAAWYDVPELPFNLVFAGVAEEEISGPGGVQSLLPLLPPLTAAIIGEPTGLELAVAEKGLLVLDCVATGRAGHAARDEGENALYAALRDVEWFRTYAFPEQSPWLGAVKMTVTVIATDNQAHNVVPDRCRFVVDVRLTDAYTPEAVLDVIRRHVGCAVTPRSMRLRATSIALDHPLVRAAVQLGKNPYGSPTLSDKALLPVPALKVGPGESARSHTADEYIELGELQAGVAFYHALLEKLRLEWPAAESLLR